MTRSKWILILLTTLVACAGDAEEPLGSAVAISAAPMGTTYFLNDARGTPFALADGSGSIVEQRSHHALGASRNAEPVGDAHDFVGNEFDTDVGISDFNARPYRNDIGTFLTPDPVAVFNPGKIIGDPRRAHAYAYSAGDPVNLQDSSGEFFDVLVDVASIGYDIYSIVTDNIVGNEDNLGTNLAALGADVVGAVVPFGTGGGAAVRAATHGDEAVKVSRTIFVGGTNASTGFSFALRGVSIQVGKGVAAVAEGYGEKNAAIFARAIQKSQAKGASSFHDHLGSLAGAVSEAVPQGQVWKLGELGGKPIFGAVRNGLGIVDIKGVTSIVHAPQGGPIKVLGELMP